MVASLYLLLEVTANQCRWLSRQGTKQKWDFVKQSVSVHFKLAEAYHHSMNELHHWHWSHAAAYSSSTLHQSSKWTLEHRQ